MVFNSLEFALFFPLLYIVYLFIYKRETSRDILLLVASYFFYMCWYWQYAGLIALSTVVDFYLARAIYSATDQSRKKMLLFLSLFVNLGILAIFKYFNFFSETSVEALALMGIQVDPIVHSLLLPVGISFYTFQTLSYTIDIYKGEIKPERSFVKFAVFVAFFPQLVAGPIVRAKEFLPQLHSPKYRPSIYAFNGGLLLVWLGLFKKIIVADMLAYLIVDAAFENPENYSSWDLLMGLYAYSLQIYCDFSGYSDIAIGIALMLGFYLPTNFNRPYQAQTPSDFWRRWHMTLSRWFTDYVYKSLGGNRLGKLFTLRNLIITMFLSGLWHGAGINFILWGLYHGLLLVIFRNSSSDETGYRKAFKILLTYHLVVFGWLMFRSPDFETFSAYLSGLTALTFGSTLSILPYIIMIAAFTVHLVPVRYKDAILRVAYVDRGIIVKSGIAVALLMLFVGLSLGTPSFIYFQF